MDLDFALYVDEPPTPIESSMPYDKNEYKQWEQSNHLGLMLIKSHNDKSIMGSIPECS